MTAATHTYERESGEQVVISWTALPKRGWRIQVAIDGGKPTIYTTQNEPHEWSAAFEAEDRADYARLVAENGGAK